MMKRKFFAAAMLLIMLCLALCGAALAAQEPAVVSQRVEITAAGQLPTTRETLTVVMKALDDANPMPGGRVGGTASIDILVQNRKGNTGTFAPMTFDHVGTYKYQLWQKPGTHKRGTYDDTVYTMTVTVTNSADYESLEAIVTFRDDEGGPKPDNDLFHNSYASDPGTITPTGVADDWPYYLAASAALLLMSLILLTKLRRKEALETDAGIFAQDEEEEDHE